MMPCHSVRVWITMDCSIFNYPVARKGLSIRYYRMLSEAKQFPSVFLQCPFSRFHSQVYPGLLSLSPHTAIIINDSISNESLKFFTNLNFPFSSFFFFFFFCGLMTMIWWDDHGLALSLAFLDVFSCCWCCSCIHFGYSSCCYLWLAEIDWLVGLNLFLSHSENWGWGGKATCISCLSGILLLLLLLH